MGLFSKKEIYQYKLLERYWIDIEEVNKRFNSDPKANTKYLQRDYCELVAESSKYMFYRYLAYEDGSGGYILRQTKSNPSYVVYFGESKYFNIVFYDHLFQTSQSGELGRFFITIADADDGRRMRTNWLSPNGNFVNIGGYGRFYCQDSVKDATVEGDSLIFKIHREKAGNINQEPDNGILLNEDIDYELVVNYVNGKFVASSSLARASTGSNNRPETNKGIKNEMDFYNECLEKYVKIAQENSLAKRGVIFVPELLQFGQSYELRLLTDQHYIDLYKNDPSQYYFVLFQLSLIYGLIAGSEWHYAFSSFKETMEKAYYNNSDYLPKVLRDLGISQDTLVEVMNEAFKEMMELHEPYWKLNDPRGYTFNGLLASYQLGVSMILGVLGY